MKSASASALNLARDKGIRTCIEMNRTQMLIVYIIHSYIILSKENLVMRDAINSRENNIIKIRQSTLHPFASAIIVCYLF